MTPEERQKLEEEYPQFNWDRMKRALLICLVIMVVAALFV